MKRKMIVAVGVLAVALMTAGAVSANGQKGAAVGCPESGSRIVCPNPQNCPSICDGSGMTAGKGQFRRQGAGKNGGNGGNGAGDRTRKRDGSCK